MDKKQLVLVTGMSGAGKTQTMAIFENLQYICIDNYPVELLENFTDYFKNDAPYNKVAMAIRLHDAQKAIRVLSNDEEIELSIIFLDCDDNTIVKRYKQTRRTHPLMINSEASTLLEAIQIERKQFDQLKSQAHYVLDTSLLKPKALQQVLESKYNRLTTDIFRVTFVSFGFKHGIPKDADLVLDVRFLPNPFYVEELRPLTGNDKEVYDYVMEKEETSEFIKKAMPFYDYLLSEYEKEGKMQVTVAIGCTGGQHRSVTLTNYFYEHFSSIYQCYKYHRDADH